MRKWVYLVPLGTILGRSTLHYFCIFIKNIYFTKKMNEKRKKNDLLIFFIFLQRQRSAIIYEFTER